MAKSQRSQNSARAFLTALTRYVDFRLTDEGQTMPAPENVRGFIDRFEAFVMTRPGAKSHPKMCKKLVEKMSKLKEARGTRGPTPDSPRPGG